MSTKDEALKQDVVTAGKCSFALLTARICLTHVCYCCPQCMQILKMTLTRIAYVTKCLTAFPHEQRDGECVDVKNS